MARKFSYKTLADVLERLEEEGVGISRPTYYRKEKELELPSNRIESKVHKWRVYNESQIEEIVDKFKKHYNIL